MFSSRVRLLASTVLLGGALTFTSIGGAFAAPVSPDASTTPVATTTSQTTPPTARHIVQHRIFSGILKPVADLFGVSPRTVVQQLLQGKTLAQIAGTYGKSANDVETALMGSLKARLDHLVAIGKITPDQETRVLNAAPNRLNKLVNTNLSSRLKAMRARQAAHRTGHPAGQSTATSQPQS